jgi:hypothetical protein
MSGYVSSWIEQYASPTPTCQNQQTSPITSDCLLWVFIGVVFLSMKFEKKHPVTK